MDARTGRRQKRISKRQEEKTAADLGGRTQANSGATRMGGGGDVRVTGKLRIECKFTESPTFVLKLAELEKLRKQANSAAEIPVFQFEFKTRGGGSIWAVTFNDPVPEKLLFKHHATYAKSVVLKEQDLMKVFSEDLRVEGYDQVFKNDSIVLQFLNDDAKGCWLKSFRIRPWEVFLKEQGEQDA